MAASDWMSAAIASYGYVALFVGAVVEGPVATVIGAFLASRGFLEVAFVYAVVVSGDLVGDLLFYGIGRSGRMALLVWHGGLGERQQTRLAILKERFHAHPGRTLLFGKLTHAAGFLVLFAAGAARVPMSTFLWYNLLGTLPKAAAFVAIGYFAGAAYLRIDSSYVGVVSLASLAALLLIALGMAIYFRRRQGFDLPEA